MKTLSACLIIKNEELVIERCLLSLLPICDEIIVVDTGSQDNTLPIVNNLIVKNSKIKLFHFEWRDDFAWARNFSFSKATKDYVMWVDADEVFTKKLNDTILRLKENDFNNYDIIATSIQFYYNKNDYSFVNRERILLRMNEPYWRYRVHELLIRNTVKPDNSLNEYIIPLDDGYVFHEKKKESNFRYYFQIYCDEINKNNLPYSHHNLYYLTWMCNFYDKTMAKIYAYDVFMNLPKYKYDIDYREWFENNLLTKEEYEVLKLLSFLKTSFVDNGYIEKINYNIIMLFKDCKKLYYNGKYFAAYYGFKFILDNKMYFKDFNSYEEKIYEYFGIILWELKLINDFFDLTKNFYKKYPSNKIALQNSNFVNLYINKIKNITLIINLKHNEWNLPHILYIVKSLFNKIIIVTDKNIDYIIENLNVSLVNKADLNIINGMQYLCINDDYKSNIEKYISILNDYYFNNKCNDNDVLLSNNKEKILDFF